VKHSILFLLAINLGVPGSIEANSGNTTIESFSNATHKLLHNVYPKRQKSIYCGCDYKINSNGKAKPILESCGYIPKGSGVRASRIEWEHIVPVHSLGENFSEWESGHPDCKTGSGRSFKGRRCVEKVHKSFRLMQSDMHNLYPSVGEINGYRVDYEVAIVSGESREFGECDAEIQNKKFEPTEKIRGEIARTYLYMAQSYPDHFELSSGLRKLIEGWEKKDPVTKWECERESMIASIQGNHNNFVRSKCDEINMLSTENKSIDGKVDNMEFSSVTDVSEFDETKDIRISDELYGEDDSGILDTIFEE
jgi:deoxyribonuclease-1